MHNLLQEAIGVLALPAEHQVRVNGPGCVACDLFEDFRNARNWALHNNLDLTDAQRAALAGLVAAFDSLEEGDCECFNNAVLERPRWNHIRRLAVAALESFGWQGTEVQPFVEVEPGIWRRPPNR